MKELRLYGEMRTGTNYLAMLLKRHYEVDIYWFNKHEVFDGTDKDNIITIKNPYSWIWSMLNCKVITKRTLYKHIATENQYTDYELQKVLIERYNTFYSSFLGIAENKKEIIPFEKILVEPEKVIENIATKFDLKKIKDFENIEREVRSEERLLPLVFDRKNFYLNHLYLEKLSEETKAVVKSNLDKTLLKQYNYIYEGEK